MHDDTPLTQPVSNSVLRATSNSRDLSCELDRAVYIDRWHAYVVQQIRTCSAAAGKLGKKNSTALEVVLITQLRNNLFLEQGYTLPLGPNAFVSWPEGLAWSASKMNPQQSNYIGAMLLNGKMIMSEGQRSRIPVAGALQHPSQDMPAASTADLTRPLVSHIQKFFLPLPYFVVAFSTVLLSYRQHRM